VRPASIGATLLSVDDSALRDIPGARVVRKGNFLGVVADREEDVVRAAKAIKPTWSDAATLPVTDALYETLIKTSATDRSVTDAGDVPAAIAGAAKTVKAQYRWPFRCMHRLALPAASPTSSATRPQSGRRRKARIRSKARWRS
jgi:nicotinate dehydrogenase subunit B